MSDNKKGAALNVVDFDYSVDGFNKHFKMIMAPFDFKSGDVNKVIDVRNNVVRQLTKFRESIRTIKYGPDGTLYAIIDKSADLSAIINEMNRVLLTNDAKPCPINDLDPSLILDILSGSLNWEEPKEGQAKNSNIEGGSFILQPFKQDADKIVAVNIKFQEAKDKRYGNIMVTCPAKSFANTSKKKYMYFKKGAKQFDHYLKYIPTLDGRLKPYNGTSYGFGDSTYIAHGYRRMSKAKVPFFDYESIEVLDNSKVGIMFSIMQQIRDKYPDIVKKLEFERTPDFDEDNDHFGKRSKTNDHLLAEMRKICSGKDFGIVNYSTAETSKDAISILSKDLDIMFGARLVSKDEPTSDMPCFVLLDKAFGDERHDRYPDKAVQHISMESYGDKRLESTVDLYFDEEKQKIVAPKGFPSGITSLLYVSMSDLLMKCDILSGEQSYLKWIVKDKLVPLPDKPLYFIERPRRKVIDENGETSMGYGNMVVLEYGIDGSIDIKDYETNSGLDEWLSLCWSVFDEDVKGVKGIVSDKDNIYVISNTDFFTVPDSDKIRKQLDDNAKDGKLTQKGTPSTSGIRNSPALLACMDVRRHSYEDGLDYYFVGIGSYDLQTSVECAPNMNKIERIFGEDPIPKIIYQMMVVPFVRFKQLSVMPYPFKYIHEYEGMNGLSDDPKGAGEVEIVDPGEAPNRVTLDMFFNIGDE